LLDCFFLEGFALFLTGFLAISLYRFQSHDYDSSKFKGTNVMPSLTKSDKNMTRLFFAIELPQELKNQLELLQRQCPFTGRPVSPHNFHITLLFLGELPDSQLVGILEAIEVPEIKPFEIELKQFAYYPKAEVGCLEVTPNEQLIELHQHIRRNLKQAGIHIKLPNKPFRPHITLYRDATVQSDISNNVDYQLKVAHFCLMESQFNQKGVYYEVVEEWPTYEPTIKEQFFGIKD